MCDAAIEWKILGFVVDEEDDDVGGASCRRILSRSNGAVMARAPNPAAAPAMTSCQCG